jgi:DNA polymerase-3 subunit alpha
VFDQYPELYKAQALEGNLRGMSVHAAGLVVANEPLTNSCAVYVRTDKKTGDRMAVVSLDKYDAEYLNVLKIDALGLTTMGAIRIALELIDMSLEELYAVPLDDPKTLQGFQDNDVVGVFQFDGRAMRSVNREVRPDNFNEVADVNALARPGPLHSGAAAQYIMVKHGRKEREFLHDVVSRITAHTQGQIVYQEQILQIVRELGGFTWEEAANVRKLIAKKQGEQAFNRLQDRFVSGALSNGVTEGTALKVWKYLVTAGAYAFNAAHCVSYGMLAFWTMWLKQHHPQAFFVAALRKYDPKEKQPQLLRDAARKGITILPPHANLSGVTWEVEGEAIRAGLTQISGIGVRAAEDLLRDRPPGGWHSPNQILRHRPKGAAYSIKTVRLLDEIRRNDDPFGLQILSRSLARLRARLADTRYQPTHTSADVPYEPKQEGVTWCGVVRERNLKDLYELHRSRTGEELDRATVKDPNLVNWVVLLGEDDTDLLTITISRWQYPRLKEAVFRARLNKDLIVVRGTTTNQYRRAIYVNEIWVVREDE